MKIRKRFRYSCVDMALQPTKIIQMKFNHFYSAFKFIIMKLLDNLFDNPVTLRLYLIPGLNLPKIMLHAINFNKNHCFER